MAAPKPSGHIPALDGIRGLAALLVILHHFSGPWTPSGSTEATIHALSRAGWVGVDLFFALSGFLITGILLDTKDRPGYFRTFYVRRTLRIFPLYYGVLITAIVGSALVAPGLGDLQALRENQAWYWTYTTNILLVTRGVEATPLVHFWTLAVEEQFYLVWPLVVWACSTRTLWRVCVGLLVFGPLLRTGLTLLGVDPQAMYVLTVTRIDGLALGAVIALALRDPAVWTRLVRSRVPTISSGLAIVAMSMLWHGELDSLAPDVQIIGYTALAALSGAGIVTAIESPRSWWARAMSMPWLRFVGTRSYAVYVVHFPILSLMLRAGLSPNTMPVTGFVLLGALTSIGVAQLSWHAYEKWFLRLKDRLAPSERAIGLEKPRRTVVLHHAPLASSERLQGSGPDVEIERARR